MTLPFLSLPERSKYENDGSVMHAIQQVRFDTRSLGTLGAASVELPELVPGWTQIPRPTRAAFLGLRLLEEIAGLVPGSHIARV